jgi:hypothetical protein
MLKIAEDYEKLSVRAYNGCATIRQQRSGIGGASLRATAVSHPTIPRYESGLAAAAFQ